MQSLVVDGSIYNAGDITCVSRIMEQRPGYPHFKVVFKYPVDEDNRGSNGTSNPCYHITVECVNGGLASLEEERTRIINLWERAQAGNSQG